MNGSADQGGSYKGLLSTYLLNDCPGCVVLIGSQNIDIQWPDAALVPLLLRFARLTDYSNTDKVAPVVAILQLDAQTLQLNEALGCAVRLFPNQLIVCLEDFALSEQVLFAFGFRRLNVVNGANSSGKTRWFEYRLSTYKSSPDWLNARFWANPDRFDANEDDEPDVYSEEE